MKNATTEQIMQNNNTAQQSDDPGVRARAFVGKEGTAIVEKAFAEIDFANANIRERTRAGALAAAEAAVAAATDEATKHLGARAVAIWRDDVARGRAMRKSLEKNVESFSYPSSRLVEITEQINKLQAERAQIESKKNGEREAADRLLEELGHPSDVERRSAALKKDTESLVRTLVDPSGVGTPRAQATALAIRQAEDVLDVDDLALACVHQAEALRSFEASTKERADRWASQFAMTEVERRPTMATIEDLRAVVSVFRSAGQREIQKRTAKRSHQNEVAQ